MKVIFLAVMAAFFIVSITSNEAQAQDQKIDILVLTSVFAPLQMLRDDQPSGFAIEIVQELLKRVKIAGSDLTSSIKILPWKRAFLMATREPGALFFSISRTLDREDMFHWIGEISPYNVFFYKLKKNTSFQLKNMDDIQNMKLLIGVQDGSNSQDLLDGYGLSQGKDYVTYPHYTNGIRMLFRDRFAMLPLTSFAARANTCRLGFNGDEIEQVIRITPLSKPLWIAFNKDTPPDLVSIFRKVYETLVEEGFVQATQERYIQEWLARPCVAD